MSDLPSDLPSDVLSGVLSEDKLVDQLEDQLADQFAQFSLSEPVAASLKKMGYSTPTDVQLRCLPILLAKGEASPDLVALARTGTGKTAAFGIPIIEKIDTGLRRPQALVLCPTRELCKQVATNLAQIGQMKRVKVLSIYGGDSYRRQFEGLSQGPHIVVATPGRLIDLLDRKAVDFSSVKHLVLDEADEMISIGFRDALDEILKSFSEKKENSQHATWLFSATMSPDIKRVQSHYIHDAVMIDARGEEEKPLIRQQYMLTFEEDRVEALKRYLYIHDEFYGLIFCQTKAEVADIEAELGREGFLVDSLHGDKAQRDREAVFAAWKKKTVKIVVATDVAARGLDVKGLTHVVNMSLPRENEIYVHRIGRTGRAGQEGIALSFVWPKKIANLKAIEKKLGVKLEHIKVPRPEEIAQALLKREISSLFSEPLQFEEKRRLHQMVRGLISEKQEFSEETLEAISALSAKAFEIKNPGIFQRKEVRDLGPEKPLMPSKHFTERRSGDRRDQHSGRMRFKRKNQGASNDRHGNGRPGNGRTGGKPSYKGKGKASSQRQRV